MPVLEKQNSAKLLQHLRDANTHGKRIKLADLGGDPEESFEQAFAQLGFTYIKDKAPRLLQKLKGFQLVDRNEDNTRAVGVFGAMLNNEWIYLPIFFLNGDLKGHELLYMKSQDMFVPLKENWVNYLLSKKPHVLGEQTGETLRQLGVLQPNIRQLSVPPYSTKYSSAGIDIPDAWEDWAVEFLPSLGTLTTKSPREKYAEDEMTLKLASSSLTYARMLKQACDTNPEINRLCRQFYGDNFMQETLLSLREKIANTPDDTAPVSVLNPKSRVPAATVCSVLGGVRPIKRAAGPPVEITVEDDVAFTDHSELDDEEKTDLASNGYLVRDFRTGEEVSKAYSTQKKVELVNPDTSGVYEVLVKPGKFEKMLVIAGPATGKGRQDFSTVIRTSSPKNWLNVHRNRLWVKPHEATREETAEAFDALSGSDSLNTRDTYVALSVTKQGTLDGSTPFYVLRNLGDGRYQVHWHDRCDAGRPTVLGGCCSDTPMPYHPSGSGQNWGTDPELHGRGDLLHLSDREGSRAKVLQGTLLLPKEHKVISLTDAKKGKDTDPEDPWFVNDYQSQSPPIEPGNWADLQTEILQKSAGLTIRDLGSNVCINADTLPRREALFSLIRDHGFREKDAEELLSLAKPGKPPEHFRVKYAQGYPLMVGNGENYGPAMPEQEYAADMNYAAGGVPTVEPQISHLPAQGLESSQTDPATYDTHPEAMIDPMAAQTGMQAGQMGQKEVFDTSMMSGLLKATRQDSMVDRYLGDLMKGLDRLGRLLFMFYWHNDEFSDRYGDSDVPELEDTLRNAFEMVGDLVLFLKEKDVGSLPGVNMGSPDVQDAAD